MTFQETVHQLDIEIDVNLLEELEEFIENLVYVEFVLERWLLKVKYPGLLRLVGRGDIFI